MGIFDGLAGGLTGGIISYFGQEETNRSNAQQAQSAQQASAEQSDINRTWQKMMSDTAYQRAVKDMQAAGLNPMLAYQNGGASSPSGATGLAFQAQMGNSLGSAVEGFNRSRSVSADVEQKQADVGVKGTQETLNKSLESKTKQEEKTSAALADSYEADAALKIAQARVTSSQDMLNRSSAAGIDAARARDKALQPVYEAGGSIVDALIGGDKRNSNVHDTNSAAVGSSLGVYDKVRRLSNPDSYFFGKRK